MSGAGRISALERQERWARVAWSALAEPRNLPALTSVATHGAVDALAALRGRTSLRSDLGPRLADLDVDQLARVVEQRRIRVLIPGDEEWPDGVNDLCDPPFCLYVDSTGDLADLVRRSVSLVGARAASDYGLTVAADIAEGLAGRRFTMVSGAAYGIDAAGHRGTLGVDGFTVAVLASGVDRPYPSAHAGLLRDIARTGAVVSEVPPGCAPYRSRFLARNRIIAALGCSTVVVEASLRSGSLSTAREARTLLRPVGAVPGPVTSMTSAGCHALLRETDAVLVTDAAEVADLAGRIGEDLLAPREDATRSPVDDLDPTAYALWSALPVRGGAATDRLAVSAGLSVARVLGVLASLEAGDLAVRVDGGWRKAPAAPRGPAGR
ncbi:MAG: DNA-processing protein DprA [Ornithinibacter sp.]